MIVEASPEPLAARAASPRALHAAAEIFSRWQEEQARSPLDRIVTAEFRTRRYLNSRERRWIAAVVYGCARFQRRLNWLLARHSLPDTPETRLQFCAVLLGLEAPALAEIPP